MLSTNLKFTKVSAKWIFNIPENAKVLVKEGDEVDLGQAVIEVGIFENITNECGNELARFPIKKVREMVEKYQGQNLSRGQELIAKSGILGKKFLSPESGVLVGIDEFDNLVFRKSETIKNILSPVKGRIGGIKDNNLELLFRAREVEGKGLNESKAWANCNFKLIGKIGDINYETVRDRVILMEEWNQAWVAKAEVLGVLGFIVKRVKIEEVTTDLPVLIISGNDFEKLVQYGRETRVLLNSKKERILLVVE